VTNEQLRTAAEGPRYPGDLWLRSELDSADLRPRNVGGAPRPNFIVVFFDVNDTLSGYLFYPKPTTW